MQNGHLKKGKKIATRRQSEWLESSIHLDFEDGLFELTRQIKA